MNPKFKKIILSLLMLGVLAAVSYQLINWRRSLIPLFRTSHSDVMKERVKKNPERAHNINREGLAELNISGSGYLNIDHIRRYRDKINKPLMVVCLLSKKEPYITDWHLHFYGLHLGKDGKIEKRQPKNTWQSVQWVLRRFVAGIPQDDPVAWTDAAMSEEERLALHGIDCKRFLYRDDLPKGQHRDYWVLDWSWVDNYIKLMESFPKDTAIHFHCEHGRGRTTTCMALYDIFRNWDKVSVIEIVDRQWAIGGEDLFNTKHFPGGTWSQEMLNARRDLAITFHKYMSDHANGYGRNSFADWLKIDHNDPR